jgi:hypothetical protein
VQEARDGVARGGAAVRAGGVVGRYCDETPRRQSVEAFCDRDVAGAPAGRSRTHARVGQPHDDGLGACACCPASAERAPGKGHGCAGPARLCDSRPRLVAVLDPLCGGWRGCQGGLQPRAASECGGGGRRVRLERPRHGPLRHGPCDPVSQAELCCPSTERLQRPLGVRTRRVWEGWVLRGDWGLERGPWRVPRGLHVVGTPGLTPQPRADALLRESLGQLRRHTRPWAGAWASQVVHLGLGQRRHGREPLLDEVVAGLALDHPAVTHDGKRLDATPARALRPLRRQGLRRWGIAGHHCDRNGRPVLVAESAQAPLQRPGVPSAMGAKGGQGVGWPVQGAPGPRRHQPAGRLRLWSRRTEASRSPCLGPRQPIQMRLERVCSKRAAAQPVTGRVGQRETPGREAGAWRDPPSAHVPQRQLPCSGRAQRLGDPEASGDVVDRPHRTKRRSVLQRARVRAGAQRLQGRLVSQGQPPGGDLGLGTRPARRHGAMASVAVGARRRAPQMPRSRLATTGAVRGRNVPSGYTNSRAVG